MTKEEPHEVLGVNRNSTRTEIKAAYYRQAKQWHPDKNSTAYAAERFKAVQKAMHAMLQKQEGGPSVNVGSTGATWKPEARRAQSWTRGGIPTTLAFCGASIAFGFVMFSVKWHQHEMMYPRQPRSLIKAVPDSQAPTLPNDAPKNA